jgi:hypothetical protein
MKDIGTRLVANLDLFTEFSHSVEATAEWWNYVKADLDNPKPTVLPLQKGSSDEIFSKWVEIQQGFERYHHKVRLYFCRRVLLPEKCASNLHDVTLGELSTRALPRTPRIFQHRLTMSPCGHRYSYQIYAVQKS